MPCLISVARTIVTNGDFDNSRIDALWRVNIKELLTSLYKSLKMAGMEEPLDGMHINTRSLFKSLKIEMKNRI